VVRAAGPTHEQWLKSLEADGRASRFTLPSGRTYAFARERVPVIQALFPDVALEVTALPGDAPLDREVAARQLVRGWMEVLGPVTSEELQERLSLTRYDVDAALAKLESIGQVLRGKFRAGLPADVTEWCDRRLLQRIHRLTVGRLRREIEPLSAQDFMRFLFRWHHVDSEHKPRGPGGLAKIVALLEGYEAPAAAWEQSIFPARMKHYVGEWLEHACFAGEVAWGRLTLKEPKPPSSVRRGLVVDEPVAPPRRAMQGRAASLTFVKRLDLEWLLHAARPNVVLADGPRPWPADLSHAAKDVLGVFERRGASFFAELQAGSRRLPTEVEDALWELLSRGLITADAVQNLRVLQSPKLRRRQRALQRGGPGRWSLLQPHEQVEATHVEEQLAWLFLRRYGIVFRDLVVREPLAPAWRELLPWYRRLEARGEIRGGRFLAGFAGEQFALPEAVETARAVRREPKAGTVVRVSAVDPLNLTGIVTPGPRVASILGQEVRYVDGVPEAMTEAASLAD
jgi:ATP-dependent Lhr-like helicase